METYFAIYDNGLALRPRRDITADVVRLRRSLALAVSALKCGEPLPLECEETLAAVSIGRPSNITPEYTT